MAATRDARAAKRKLAELGITSATVLTGSTTITLDLAAFDQLCARSGRVRTVAMQDAHHAMLVQPARRRDLPGNRT